MSKNYDSSSVKHLSYRDSVREKPGMYIGSTDEHGIFTLLREVADNVVDEALGGHASSCDIYISADGSYSVWDNGRGMPVGMMTVKNPIDQSEVRINSLVALTSLLHAGGKLSRDSQAYENSRGSHGCGLKGTNFLSDFCTVTTFFKGQWYSISYTKGELAKDVHKCAAPKTPTGETLKKGTYIHFKPDFTKFSAKRFPMALLTSWASIASFFTQGLRVNLHHHSGKEVTYFSENGPVDYIREQMEKLEADCIIHDEPIQLSGNSFSCVFQFSNADGHNFRGFTNGLSNPDGGSHLEAFFRGMQNALQPYIKKGQEFGLPQLKDGLVGCINVTLSAPNFTSQTKEKLADPRVSEIVAPEIEQFFVDFFKKNKQTAHEIIERAVRLRQASMQYASSKRALTVLKKHAKKGLPSKLVLCDKSCPPEKREIYILEGDSASGSAKKAFDKSFQEVLPIRGKFKNSEKVGDVTKEGISGDEALLKSEEVLNILSAIGFDAQATDPLANLRCGKLIYLTDADPDGSHIDTLITTLLNRFLPELFDRGIVYALQSPEFVCQAKNGKLYLSDSLKEISAQMREDRTTGQIIHLKGHGEATPELLNHYAFNPSTRKLLQLHRSEDTDLVISQLMGKDTSYRRSLLGI